MVVQRFDLVKRYLSAMVTGAAGFIGSHLVDRLAREGFRKVIALDDFSTGRMDNLTSVKSMKNVEIVKADVTDPSSVETFLADISVVFHLAAIVGVELVKKLPLATLDTNISGTRSILKACVKSGARRLVYASSSEVYGESPVIPMDEGLPPSPISPYGVSKLVGETYCRQYYRANGLETVAVRFFNVYGPRQRSIDSGAVVPSFISAALAGRPMMIHGTGMQTRDFTYIDDAVEAMLLAAYRGDGKGSVYNVGTGIETSMMELSSILRRILGNGGGMRHVRSRPLDVQRRCAAISKTTRALGYKPRVRLEDGLRLTCEYYRKLNRI